MALFRKLEDLKVVLADRTIALEELKTEKDVLITMLNETKQVF